MDIIDKDIKTDNERQLKYSFLKDCLIDSYNKELARKDRLESKALGLYTVVGIFFAAFLVIEPLLIPNKPLCSVYHLIFTIINYCLVFIFLVLFGFAFFYLFRTYSIQQREEVDVLEKWEEILEKPFDVTIESLKVELLNKIKKLSFNNDKKVKNIEITSVLCIFICAIIIFLFILLVVQKSFL